MGEPVRASLALGEVSARVLPVILAERRPEARPLPDDNESVKAIRALELALKETP